MKLSHLVLILYVLAALLGCSPWFQPQIDLSNLRADLAPSGLAWFGTDHLGRDVLLLTIQGCKVALFVGCLAATTSLLLGTIFGSVAGWKPGWVDAVLLWMSGSVAAIPNILLVLVLSWMLGGGYVGVFLAVGLVSWVSIYRLIRVETQRLRQAAFVQAACLTGASFPYIFWKHLLPNLRPILRTQFLLHFLYAIKAEVILSFLGIGMQGHLSWGTMIADAWAFDDLGQARWWTFSAATLAMATLILTLQKIASQERLA